MTDRYVARKEFIKAAGSLWEPIMNLTHAWEKLTNADNNETAEKYPFKGSFDEWIYEYAGWFDNLAVKFVIQTEDFSPTITVKELKEILALVDDDTQIVVSDKARDWWLNIDEVQLPDEDNGCFTLTFHTKDDFDTRQF
jgi:hypothetical protein